MAGLGSPPPSSSSSSSNLSALAPPFTVDRTNSKPTTNPPLRFSDTPYAASFGHTWQYANSAALGPDMYKKSELDVDSTKITSMPVAQDYSFRFSVSQSNKPQSSNWSTLNPTPKNPTHPFLYDCKVEPYCPPYVSPVVDEDIPLVALSEPSYDMLPSPGLVSASLSSQVDYTQSLFGLDYTPQWGDSWNGLVDAKRGKLAEFDGSISLAKTNAGGAAAYTNYVNQGCHMAGSGNILEDSGISCGQFSDAIGRESSNGLVRMEHADNTSLVLQKVLSLPFDSSRTTISSCGFTIPESLPPGLSLQSPRNFMSYQSPYNPYDKCNRPIDSYVSSPLSVTKSTPALVIRPPSVGTASAPQRAASGETVDILSVATSRNEGLVSINPSIEKGPQVFLNSKEEEGYSVSSQLNSRKDGSDKMSSLSSSVVEEPSRKLQTKDTLNHGLRVKSGSQVLSINASDGLFFSGDNVQHIKSSEKFSDCLDHHNPAVDSPCWKGAPASHFSPFHVLGSEKTPHFLKKVDEFCHLDLEVDRTFPPLNDPIRSPSQKADEDKVEHEFGCAVIEQRSSDAAKATLNSPTLTSRKVVPIYEDSSKPGEDYCLLNHSQSDSLSKFSGTKQICVEGDNFTTTKPNIQAAALDTVMNMNDTMECGDVAVRAAENVLCSPSSEESAREQGKPCRSESTPKMNVQTLIGAMQNLSELLLFNCSSDSCALKEDDHVSIKHVISNLGALVSEKTVYMTRSQDRIVPQHEISDKVGESMDPHMSIAAGKPQFLNRASAKSHGQLDYWQSLEEKRNHNVFGDAAESFQQFCLLKHDLDVLRDDNMAQAIRKVLNENFHFGEEMQSDALLFKNLWLEAEAKLCSISYRARFDRMKIEMEKFKSNHAKDVSENAAASKKSSSSNNSLDLNTSVLPPPNTETVPVPKTTITSSPSYTDDAEASVMSRLHVLKCRDYPRASNLVGRVPADDVESPVMARLGILKCQEDMKASNLVRQLAADDVESSVITRHHILKCRDDPKPLNLAGQQADVVHAVYADEMPFIGDQSVDLGGAGYDTVKGFLLSAADDSVTQSSGSSGQRNHYSLGSNDNSSSDWEHVLKDDVSWR